MITLLLHLLGLTMMAPHAETTDGKLASVALLGRAEHTPSRR